MDGPKTGQKSFKSRLVQKFWTKNSYFVSTNPDLIPTPKLIAVFDSPEFYWAKTLPEPVMLEMLGNSLVFGLYHTPTAPGSRPSTIPDLSTDAIRSRADLIGFARCVTDFTTFVYVTDVWVESTHQGKGLGTWLVTCIQEVVEDMPHLRRSMLFTADWERSVPFYKKIMGMNLIETRVGEGLAIMERKGQGHPSYGSVGNSYTQ